MISDEDKKYILNRAYIPEHSIDLITTVSGGEPFLIDDYFCCRKGDWLIIVGYPLNGEYAQDIFENFLQKIKKRFRPEYISLMAPEIPPAITAICREKQCDYFYTLNIQTFTLKGALKRTVNKARKKVFVERSSRITPSHDNLAQEFIKQVNPSIEVVSMATPLLVPMIEESFIYDDISNAIIRAYLSDKRFKGIHTLILGCTHYPIIKKQIERFFEFNIDVIDSGDAVASRLKKLLDEKDLLNTGKKGEDEFYISDYTPYFKKISKMFFGETIRLELLNFWK